MSYEKIRVEVDQRVAVVTLCDPARMNAMSLQMREEIMQALRAMEDAGEADAVVFVGDGPKAFSAGADVNELRTRTVERELSLRSQVRRDLPRMLERMRLPSIAAINGYCFGAGLELALACTLRIAAEGAKLGLPEINLGVIPGSGGTQRLARMVGVGKAMEMITLGEPVDAQEALRIGLVTSVHAPGDLIPAARAIAAKWQSKGPVSLMAARDAVLASADVDLLTGIDLEQKLFALCIASGERDVGVDAFLARRKPQFRGGGDS